MTYEKIKQTSKIKFKNQHINVIIFLYVLNSEFKRFLKSKECLKIALTVVFCPLRVLRDKYRECSKNQPDKY